MVIALFLVENGCNWMKTNKKNRTPAAEISLLSTSIPVWEILKREGHRYYLKSILNSIESTQLENISLWVGSECYGLDQECQTLCESFIGKN